MQPDLPTKETEDSLEDIEEILSCFPDLSDFKRKLIIQQYKQEEDKKLHTSYEFFDQISNQQF